MSKCVKYNRFQAKHARYSSFHPTQIIASI